MFKRFIVLTSLSVILLQGCTGKGEYVYHYVDAPVEKGVKEINEWSEKGYKIQSNDGYPTYYTETLSKQSTAKGWVESKENYQQRVQAKMWKFKP